MAEFSIASQSAFCAGKEQYDGYGEGVIFLTAKTERRPGIVDQNVNRIIDPEDFYAGCYAHADINPYAWSYMGKNGISFGLQNIQKVSDGEHIGGGAISAHGWAPAHVVGG